MTQSQLSTPEYKRLTKPLTATLIGVAFSGGQAKEGVDSTPILIAEHGLNEQLTKLGWKISVNETLHGCLAHKPEVDPDIGILKKPRYVAKVNEILAKEVESHCAKGELALTLGGDHSIALGTVSGSAAVYGDDLCLVWVDAHPDINTPETTPSGNLHGCPVAFLLGIAGKVEGYEWVKPIIRPERIAYIGIRDADEGERQILRKHNICTFSMHEIDKYGIGKVVEMALDHINPKRDLPIHLSFDVDALDPSVAPSTGTPVRGGLTFREGHFICESLAETGQLVAMDMVEINPSLGDEKALKQTVEVGCSLIRCALGETLL